MGWITILPCIGKDKKCGFKMLAFRAGRNAGARYFGVKRGCGENEMALGLKKS
jgi:hypothetical protein